MRRRNVPCSPCGSGDSCSSGCCGLKEKLQILWDRTIGSILKINNITPDGDGNFTIEAGSNIALSETGTGNGIRIDTTGGVSYYESGDQYVNVDNNDLEITVNAGSSGGLATHDDLTTVAQVVSDILDGTSTVPNASYATSAGSATSATNATNATYLGSNTANVGSDTKPIKIVNGQAVAVTNELQKKLSITVISQSANTAVYRYGKMVIVSVFGLSVTPNVPYSFMNLPTAKFYASGVLCSYNASGYTGVIDIDLGTPGKVNVTSTSLTPVYGHVIYFTDN